MKFKFNFRSNSSAEKDVKMYTKQEVQWSEAEDVVQDVSKKEMLRGWDLLLMFETGEPWHFKYGTLTEHGK